MSRETSLVIDAGGNSSSISISTTSAQSAASPNGEAVICPSVDCFVRSGANPTAVSTGADQFLVAGTQYRVKFAPGHKLAFITASGTGTVYFTPGSV